MKNDSPEFKEIFTFLREMMREYEPRLQVVEDDPGTYYLNGAWSDKYKKEYFFGAVMVQKRYVSYYLMPVYMFPELLDGVSPELLRRMQGKSCFNFTKMDVVLMDELKGLTKKGFARFKQEGAAVR
ncbi:MAG: hypothetical protein ACYC4M_04690 [Thermoleophilia bacterium]